MRTPLFLLFLLAFLACKQKEQPVHYDLIIRNGMIYDGSGNTPYIGDLAIQDDTIAAIGLIENSLGVQEIDAGGLAIAPGFINMLSWAEKSLLMDGRSVSDIKQGVTTEVFGEGWSPGPVHRKNKIQEDTSWTTLGGYFDYLKNKGMTPNVASFVGATSIRIYVLDHDNRAPSEEELQTMRELVAEAMEQGAMGLGSSLIYAPADYASTEELIELAKVASSYGGMYITHMRSESDKILKALDETFRIAQEANIKTEIYHLKINHARNWNKIDTVIAKIDSAQKNGLSITANMYPYIASATSLTARLPNWVQEGGSIDMRKRLRNPALRKKVLYEMKMGIPSKNSDPKDVMLLGFRTDTLNQQFKGKRLDEVARILNKDADETVIDLILEDRSPIAAVFFLMDEKNVQKIMQLPYVSFGSDAASMAITEQFKDWGTHPRAYGTFARVLGKYARDEKVVSLEEAIRRMTSLPASNLKITKRGSIKPGYFADLVIFDPNFVQDEATFENPQQYASGIVHVIINGKQVLANGEHTGALTGRILYGPGWKGQ